jgi:hypothetical protein
MDEEERSGGEKTRLRFKVQGTRHKNKAQGTRHKRRFKVQGTKSGTKNQGSRKFQITIINKSRINFKEKFNIPIEK